MSVLTLEMMVPVAEGVEVSDDALTAELTDGRTISVPLDWYPRLTHAMREERDNWRLIGGGEGIHWPDLDEDISVEGLIAGRPSAESQTSFQRWVDARRARRPVAEVPPLAFQRAGGPAAVGSLAESLRMAAEMAREAAMTLAEFAEEEPDFASDEVVARHDEALTTLAAAYSFTTHSGLGLVAGQLLAATLPAFSMGYWENAKDLARVGAAYAEVELAHRDKGGEMYGYTKVENPVAALGPIGWSAPDIAETDLSSLAANAQDIADTAHQQWMLTKDAPISDLPEEPECEEMLQQLADACWGLSVAGDFMFAESPPLGVLLEATLMSVARRSWSTAYAFASATALLAEHQLHDLDTT